MATVHISGLWHYERTFYNILNADAKEKNHIADEETRQLLLFKDEDYE